MGRDGATVHVDIEDLRFYGTEGHRTYLEQMREGRREAFMGELLRAAVRPGMTVVDVGAFVGYFSLLAARETGPDGRVLAFEPDPRDFPWLARNVEANGFGGRVTPFQKALTDREGELTFFLADEDQSQSSLYPTPDGGRPTSVACTTLDRILDGDRPGVIKVDVEGAELGTLEGMQNTLEAAGDEVTLFIEWNPDALVRAGFRPDDLIDRLRDLEFTPLLIDEPNRRLAPLGPFEGTYANLYCTRR